LFGDIPILDYELTRLDMIARVSIAQKVLAALESEENKHAQKSRFSYGLQEKFNPSFHCLILDIPDIRTCLRRSVYL
jgi:hypothetical protein